MTDINIQFYQTKDSTAPYKETDTTLTPEGKLPVASLEKEFGVNTLKEIRGGKAFLIGADEHGDSRNPFTNKTTIKVTGEPKRGGVESDRMDQLTSQMEGFMRIANLLAKSHFKRFEYLSDTQTRQSKRDPRFRADVHKYYYNTRIGRKIKCMITGEVLSIDVVVAGHLFKRAFEDYADDLVGLKDIDDVKNGMLMYKPIEQAFDTSIISLISTDVQPKGNVRLVVLQRKWLNRTIGDYIAGEKSLKNQNLTTGVPQTLLSKTFADLENEIDFKVVAGGPKWYSRCLAFQATMARYTAIRFGWIDESYPLLVSDEDWSEMSEEKLISVRQWLMNVSSDDADSADAVISRV